MPIRLLTADVASQIAAGEVIERPASVVKELMENALDAGAKSISVVINEAGRQLIEVADDGAGIPSDELSLAVSRHATSKLVRADDLFQISTLGFRGEALSSIGSVSRMTLTSKVENARAGGRLQIEAGKEGRVESIGAPQGTVVRVEDLFHNVPARLKFLKSDVTERRAIDALLTRYAIAYPNVRFKFMEGNTITLQTAGDGDRRAILAALYGVEIAKQLLEINVEEDHLQLSGFISPGSLTRSNRKDITFFINGRWTQDTPLTTALILAYHGLLMVGRYPLGTLLVQIASRDVDVNVHPAKAEVRFRNQDQVFSFVQGAVRRALLAYSPIPQPPPASWGGPTDSSRQTGMDWSIAHDPALAGVRADENRVPQQASVEAAASEMGQFPILRLIGQIGATYIVAEGQDGLYLIDQHAAHERVLFEKLVAQAELQKIPSQRLLTPVAVGFPGDSAKLLGSQLPLLAHFGFEIEEFGPNTFQVRSMPALFAGSDPTAALRSVVEDFEEDETPLQSEIEKKLAARVCKRMAVKGGKTLSSDEQRALLTDLENCSSPRTCPHGRPTMIHLPIEMLERQFGRRGAR